MSRDLDSEERDRLNGSDVHNMTGSLNMTRQMSDSRSRKRMLKTDPVVIDISKTQQENSTMPSVLE